MVDEIDRKTISQSLNRSVSLKKSLLGVEDSKNYVSNNDFVKDLKIGDYFTDTAFLSTTRDPFYSPGLNGTFGLILIKIKYLSKFNLDSTFLIFFLFIQM